MKKILFISCLFILSACADSKTFKTSPDNDFLQQEYLYVEPYGWADYQDLKNDSVVYRVNVGNVVLSIIFCETIVIPVWLTGWQLYEPIRLKYPTK